MKAFFLSRRTPGGGFPAAYPPPNRQPAPARCHGRVGGDARIAALSAASDSDSAASPTLMRRLGPVDATLVVMGGIVGSGIFMNPAVVARQVHTPWLILGAWAVGGAVGAARRLGVGGAGGAATAGRRAVRLLARGVPPAARLRLRLGAAAGDAERRHGGGGGDLRPLRPRARRRRARGGPRRPRPRCPHRRQLLRCARRGSVAEPLHGAQDARHRRARRRRGRCWRRRDAGAGGPSLDRPLSLDLVAAFGAAMVPVLFAYGGWQTAASSPRDARPATQPAARRCSSVSAPSSSLYLPSSAACLRALGPAGLAASRTPASDVMRAALGPAAGAS